VGAEGMVTNCTRPHGPGTDIKRSNIVHVVTCIALSLRHLMARLLGVAAQSLIETSGSLEACRTLGLSGL